MSAIVKQPEQQLFDYTYELCAKKGYNVYQSLPMDEVPYPIVVLQETQIIPKSTSSGLVGTVFFVISIWGYLEQGPKDQRKKVSDIVQDIFQSLAYVDLGNRELHLLPKASSQRVYQEDKLWRGLLNLEFKIAKK